MINILKASLTLLLLSACFVKNGLSINDEDSFTGKLNYKKYNTESMLVSFSWKVSTSFISFYNNQKYTKELIIA